MRGEIFVFVVLFIIALVSLLGIVSEVNKQYSIETPAYGGALREGILGAPRLINPVLAQTDADRDLVSLIYTGLLRYDTEGVAAPALAEKYEISNDGLEYTVTLKNKIYWQDGEGITADDVVFTVRLAKNPQLSSPRRANWEGVDVEKIDERTVKFILKKPYAPFVENLTLGIMPKHLWEPIPISQYPLVALNTAPVGAGPYETKSVSRNSVGSITSIKLGSNKYFALGVPHIKTLELNFYQTEEAIMAALKNKNIDTLALGCSHFPLVKDNIQNLAGENVLILDSGGAVSRHIKRVLKNNKDLYKSNHKGRTQFYTTAKPSEFDIMIKRYLNLKSRSKLLRV